MKTVFIFIGCLLISALWGCKESSPAESASIMESFAGNWQITSAGAAEVTGTMNIGSDGTMVINFTAPQTLTSFFPVTIFVANDGSFTGDLFQSTVNVGSVSGAFTGPDSLRGTIFSVSGEVGTVTGTLSGTTGGGTYRSIAGDGTWTASKQ